jgi:hypothetical protein
MQRLPAVDESVARRGGPYFLHASTSKLAQSSDSLSGQFDWPISSVAQTTTLALLQKHPSVKLRPMMTNEEISEFVNLVEQTWLESMVARNYLRNHCGVTDPANFLSEEVRKIPPNSPIYRYFAPVRQAISQGLRDTELFSKLHTAFLELGKQPKG